VLGGCASQPDTPGTPAFGVLGDAPYSASEVARLDRVIDEINAHELDFVVHVGDIGRSTRAQACDDEWLGQRKAQFARIRHRFILVPGDNEWSDCDDPVARLARWREFFCEDPGAYCEHRRWEAAGWVFATLNVPGNNNNAGHAEHAPRMAAVLHFLREAEAAAGGKRGLVVFMQANPFDTLRRSGYGALRAELAALGRRMPGRIVVIHGDTHVYKDDEPLPGLRRIEVWGSPFVAWTRLGFSELPSRSSR
jgi:hypothetical protein